MDALSVHEGPPISNAMSERPAFFTYHDTFVDNLAALRNAKNNVKEAIPAYLLRVW